MPKVMRPVRGASVIAILFAALAHGGLRAQA